MRRLSALFLLSLGCREARALPDDQPCIEAGTAIAARTEECTGDVELGVDRLEAFEAAYTCDLPALSVPERERDLYECAFVLRNLACELVTEHGDDLDAWLASSPVCGMILDPVGGGA